MSFRRHGEIYREACRRCADAGRRAYSADAPTHPLDEFPTGYSSAGCAPAEPASASPAGNKLTMDGHSPAQPFSANGETLLSHLSHLRGPLRIYFGCHLRHPVFCRLQTVILGVVLPLTAQKLKGPNFYSIEKEVVLGRALAENFRKNVSIIEDPVLHATSLN